MSTHTGSQPATSKTDDVSEDEVVAFLQQHSDFFERHPVLLTNMKLPHHRGSSAVSLVERQVALLRQRNTKNERKLRELIRVARANDALSAKIHALCLGLMNATSFEAAIERLEVALREEFSADRATLVLYDNLLAGDGYKNPFVRHVERDDRRLKAFATFRTGSRPRCGQMRDAQRDFLFGEDSAEIASAALVPLGEQSSLGMLGIGSRDSTHFHPAMSTDFLARLGEVISTAIQRYPRKSAAA